MIDALRSSIQFPPQLPISARVEDIMAALREHQVLIVVGATGSGKTTQLPKLALAMGRGAERQIGVTQPRRIAATSVAARVADELRCTLGEKIGFQIRFTDRSSDATSVKFMTDGILLAEIQGDPLLRRYDTLIVDEAHERSLNIDFLLGWLKRILPRRPDLKLIVSSATIEADRFSAFFGLAPVLQVEGRTYPVDVLYQPPEPSLELADAVAEAVKDITSLDPRGDVLVFLPGEREIRETERAVASLELRHTVILPLYARLSAKEQARVFEAIPERRVILATNVAETSLTLPGIVYVVDTGLARLSRYDPATGVTRLQIEGISQASADQRKGRCGRVRDGICIRLYDEKNFALRPDFTDPEMRRTGLAGVILRMKSLGLGEVEDFPFLDPPANQAIVEGYRVLEELGAIDAERRLTGPGRRLARLPVDPRVGRMILAGIELGVGHELIVLAAALAIQDPRERPRDQQAKADQCHQRFQCEHSDFIGLLRIWEHLQREGRSHSRLRRACKQSFLSFSRVREWMDLQRQLEQTVRELRLFAPPCERAASLEGASPRSRRRRRAGARAPSAQGAGGAAKGDVAPSTLKPGIATKPGQNGDAIHRALLAGLLSRIGQWDPERRTYSGARQTRFSLHPSSALAKKPPAWVMSFELVQTTRLFARTAAKIEPLWLDPIADHLLKRSYSEPHWSEKAARASVKERATLYGLPVLHERRVDYSTLSPGRARLMFLEHALVRGEYQSRGEFQKRNQELLQAMAELRDRARQSDMLVDEERLLAFFDAAVPRGIANGKAFEAWREQAERQTADLLCLSRQDVVDEEQSLRPEDYPETLELNGVEVPLRYRFEPGADDDGVTLELPLVMLPQVEASQFDTMIPAWRKERAAALLRELPRGMRRELSAFPDRVEQIANLVARSSGAMLPALTKAVSEVSGISVPENAWATDAIPSFLRFNFRIVDERGRAVAESRDLPWLLREYGARARGLLERSAAEVEWLRRGMTRWECGSLPHSFPHVVHGVEVRGFPALRARDSVVDVVLLESAAKAAEVHRQGIRALLMVACRKLLEPLRKRCPAPLSLRGGVASLRLVGEAYRDQLMGCVVDDAFGLHELRNLPRSEHQFEQLLERGRQGIPVVFQAVADAVALVHRELAETTRALDAASKQPAGTAAARSIRSQLEALIDTAQWCGAEWRRLERYPCYLRAARVRLSRALIDPRKDAMKAEPIEELGRLFVEKRSAALDSMAVSRAFFAIEELRIAVFAPELRPLRSVSVQNVSALLQVLR